MLNLAAAGAESISSELIYNSQDKIKYVHPNKCELNITMNALSALLRLIHKILVIHLL